MCRGGMCAEGEYVQRGSMCRGRICAEGECVQREGVGERGSVCREERMEKCGGVSESICLCFIHRLRRITHGASLHCCGEYVSAPMQARKDFMASSVEVLGECSPESYPFKNNVRHSLEYLRQFTHLRTRSKLFAAIMRVRSAATLHILNHFTVSYSD